MNMVIPTDTGNRLPDRPHIIKKNPLSLTWVHTHTLTDHVRATDHDTAIRLIDDMERTKATPTPPPNPVRYTLPGFLIPQNNNNNHYQQGGIRHAKKAGPHPHAYALR